MSRRVIISVFGWLTFAGIITQAQIQGTNRSRTGYHKKAPVLHEIGALLLNCLGYSYIVIILFFVRYLLRRNAQNMKKFILVLITISISSSILKGQVRIKMQKENGIFTTPCKVNGLQLKFIFDTGASNVSISLFEAIFMLKNGYLEASDLKGSSYAQIANGEIIENTTVNLKELEIGGLKLYNVEATIIHELSAPLLLGQSAIQKMGKIQLEDDELIIIDATLAYSEKACIEAKKLKEKAGTYIRDELYTLSADTYQKSYDLCPDAFDCLEIFLLGSLYFQISNYQSAIKYLSKTIECNLDSTNLYFTYKNLGICYFEIKDYHNATVNLEKSLSYTRDNDNISISTSYLGNVYFRLEKYSEAITYYEKCISLDLQSISKTMNDLMRGDVRDEFIAETLWNISVCYQNLDSESRSDNYIIRSALCGYEKAISYCKKYKLDYESYLE